MKKRESLSLNIARIILTVAAITAPALQLAASTPFIDLPTPFDVVCVFMSLTWLFALPPRVPGVYLRGFELIARGGEELSRKLNRFALSLLALAGSIYTVSGSARRACIRNQGDE